MVAISVNVTRFLGPALAGPMIAYASTAAVFAFAAAVSIGLIVVVARLRMPEVQTKADKGGFFGDLWRGAIAAGTHPTITPVLAVFAATAILIRPLYELMPAFAGRLYQGGVQDYSRLVMAVGVGAVVGAVLVTLNAPRRPTRMFMVASLGACAAFAGFAGSQGLVSGMLAAGVLGFFMCTGATASQLVVIFDAREETSGRVLSLWSTIMRAGPALGALGMGAALDWLGFRWPLVIAATLCAGFVVLVVSGGRRRGGAPGSEQPAGNET